MGYVLLPHRFYCPDVSEEELKEQIKFLKKRIRNKQRMILIIWLSFTIFLLTIVGAMICRTIPF